MLCPGAQAPTGAPQTRIAGDPCLELTGAGTQVHGALKPPPSLLPIPGRLSLSCRNHLHDKGQPFVGQVPTLHLAWQPMGLFPAPKLWEGGAALALLTPKPRTHTLPAVRLTGVPAPVSCRKMAALHSLLTLCAPGINVTVRQSRGRGSRPLDVVHFVFKFGCNIWK